MMLEEFRLSACEGKIGMSNEGAKKAEKAHKKRGLKGAIAFKCKFCGMWHVGNVKFSGKRRRELRAVK